MSQGGADGAGSLGGAELRTTTAEQMEPKTTKVEQKTTRAELRTTMAKQVEPNTTRVELMVLDTYKADQAEK